MFFSFNPKIFVKEKTMEILNQILILVVDDHALTRRGIMSILREYDSSWKIFEAEDGVQAIVIARELRPEIILLDYNMPKFNGVKTATLLAKESPASKIIIVTMETDPDKLIDSVKAGVMGIVSKNSYDNELVQAIDMVHNGIFHFPEEVVSRLDGIPLLNPRQGRTPNRRRTVKLSKREKEIFHYMIKGSSIHSISQYLGITSQTVHNHKTNIFKKCSVASTQELIGFAYKNRLLSL